MWYSYLKITLRTIIRQKVHSLINIVGLSIAIAACFFIYQYVAFEFSFDKYYPESERIYRISFQKFIYNEETERLAKSPAALASVLTHDVPEVELATQLWPLYNTTIETTRGKFIAKNAFVIDSSFCRLFSLSLIAGSTEQEGVLVSKQLAHSWFPGTDPINQKITLHGEELDETSYATEVIGVFNDLPANTHLPYDLLVISHDASDDSWQFTGCYTYAKLNAENNVTAFTKKINDLAEDRRQEESAVTIKLTPQPIETIHLHSQLDEELSPNANYSSLVFLIVIGGFILIIAWINHASLLLAQTAERIREIGIRKVAGSGRSDLYRQFLTGSSFYNLSSLLIGLGMAWSLSPYFNRLAGRQLDLSGLFVDAHFWGGVIAAFGVGLMVTGIYPALALSKIKPAAALKGSVGFATENRASYKELLMLFQFAIASFLITGTIVVYSQMHYMTSRQLGLDMSRVIVVPSPNTTKEHWSDSLVSYMIDSAYFYRLETLSDRISSNEGFRFSSVSHIPGKELIWGTEGFRREGAGEDEIHSLYMKGIDDQFFPTLDIKLIAGRNFLTNHPADQLETVIINLEASKILGFDTPEDAIGKNLIFLDSQKEIIGVVGNYHQESLRHPIKPTFYQLLPRALDYFAIRIPPGDPAPSISMIHDEWKRVFGDQPFHPFFLDDFFAQQYVADIRFTNVFMLFTVVSISLACMGLFGISSYAILRRTREIGIRKVLGATVPQIVVLLAGRYGKIVIVASLMAMPVVYLTMSEWLRQFAFRIDLQWWMFAVSLAGVVLTALVTTAYRSIQTGLTNPVQSLRSE